MGHFILADLTAEPLAVHPGGLRSQSVKVIQAAVDAAGAGGAEGNDGGVAKVTVLQKGIEYLGCLSPPDGIAQEHYIVVFRIFQGTGDGGPGGRVVLLLVCPAAVIAVIEILVGVRYFGTIS